MTSLSRQLEALATSAATKHLSLEADHSSLLFDRKEAATLDREAVHKIGSAGFAHLKSIDKSFKADAELFADTSIDFQRLQLTATENEALDEKLERFLVRLVPYLQHFAAHQALEWLIFKYHVHSFNAEFLIVNFLPFHETNIYGRLLGILRFKFESKREWAFLADYAKRKAHVPFNELLRRSLASGHALISSVVRHLERSEELVGDEYLEKRSPIIFSFLAKLLLEVLSPKNPIDDALLSKIIPVIANGVRSKLISMRLVSFMVLSKLSLSAKLTTQTTQSLLKLLVMKIRQQTMKESLLTIVVITQQQNVEPLSKKSLCKLLRREDLPEVMKMIQQLSQESDLTRFLDALWPSLLQIASDPELSEIHDAAGRFMVSTLESPLPKQAVKFLVLSLEHVSNGGKVPEALHDEIHGIVARYSDEFEKLRTTWEVQDKKALDLLITSCKLDDVVPIEMEQDEEAQSGSQADEVMEVEEKPEKPNALKMAVEAEAAMGAAVRQREKFSGDPIKKCLGWIEKEEWAKVTWALEEMVGRASYLEKQLEENLEDLFIALLKIAVDRPHGMMLGSLRDVMGTIPLKEDFLLEALQRQETEGTKKKKRKSTAGLAHSPFEKNFSGESDEMWMRRLVFTLQVLTLTPKLAASAKMLSTLFDFISEMNALESSEEVHSVQQYTIVLLLRLLTNPGKYKVLETDLRMDVVVDTMRSTLSHHLLRDSLRVLTAAVRIAPSSVVSHVLSIFTFMGAGLLKKDNELTLSIIENTLHALFTAVVVKEGKEDVTQRLIAVCKIFSASISDIPAHRRARASQAIGRAVGAPHTAVVLETFVEGFCARWQRTSGDTARSSRNLEQDAYEDMVTELVAGFPAVEQLAVVLDVLAFIIRMAGDEQKTQTPKKRGDESTAALLAVDKTIFDRSSQTLPKLRHFRFLLLGVVVRILSRRSLYDELAASSDEALLEALLPLGKRLLSASVDLDDFTRAETTRADGLDPPAGPPAVRYWQAFGSRAEIVADKLRHLMPGGVAARLITAILKDSKTDTRLREKALQMANVKLLTDGGFSPDADENDAHLNALAETLNKWIKPASAPDKIVLCQNAAFSLKLVAKHLRPTADSAALTVSMEKCTATLKEWTTLDETLVGNILLLAGELIRCHNMRATLLSAQPLMEISCAILREILASKQEEREKSVDSTSTGSGAAAAGPNTRRQRIRQQSLCGRHLGSDTMLICALTCTQRLLDHLGKFVSAALPALLSVLARLAPRFGLIGGQENVEPMEKPRDGKGSIEFRLGMIRRGLLMLEQRVLLPAVCTVAKELRAEEKPLSWILSLLASCMGTADRSWLAKQQTTLLQDVFLPLLEYRARERRHEMLDSVAAVEAAVLNCLNAYAENVTEMELRPMMALLVEWVHEGLQIGASLAARLRLPTIFHLANSLYASFNTLSLVYFGRLFDMAAKTLIATNYTKNSSPLYSLKKSSGTVEVDAAEVDFLIRHILTFVQNVAKQPKFFTADRWQLLMTPLVDELENSKLEGHESRCLALADALFPALECHPDTLGNTLQALLEKVREGKAKLSYRCMLVVERLAARIGDGLAPHLPILMPYLAELMEDDNRAVEEQTEKVVRLLQRKFGEDISEGFV